MITVVNLRTLLLLLLTLFGVGQQALADDMRPTSLSIQAESKTEFQIVFKVPTLGTKVIKLDVVFDKDTKEASAKNSYYSAGSYVQTWKVKRETGMAGMTVTVKGMGRNSTDVLLRIADSEGKNQTTVINAEKPVFEVPENMEGKGAFLTYMNIGIEHILVGLDHLLFVSCLIFVSATAKTLLQTITGFTLAHSITLVLVTTFNLNLPIPPVEAVIALSIIFLAWEIAKDKKDSLSLKYPVLVSSSFGLLHGFGFATVLGDIGLPEGARFTALAAFNVGVEIGQILFVGVLCSLFILLAKISERFTKARMRLTVSYGCGIIATVWFIERLQVFPTV
ncbi:hypothetical protein ACH42_02545 [Endozoicomonas sp. (ex Bugula neritina AB1)]|nr:hypothetical protein ACH42_02545 [Endozoicomonas sp. (ex Bugula neritina AB1)]